MLIYDAALKTPYRILGINLPKDSLLHLSNLGLAAGETIEVVTKTKNSAIIIVKGSRLAFDASILDKIDLAPAEEDQEKIPLSELPVGRYWYFFSKWDQTASYGYGNYKAYSGLIT